MSCPKGEVLAGEGFQATNQWDLLNLSQPIEIGGQV